MDLITSILVLEPSNRITIPALLNHPWFKDDADPEAPSPALSAKTPLGSTPEESMLVSHMEALGMDVEGILASVQSNACDQASALWYLLLSRHRLQNQLLSTFQPSPNSADLLASSAATASPLNPSLGLKSMLSGTPSLTSRPLLQSAGAGSGVSASTASLTSNGVPGAPSSPRVDMEQYLENARRRKSMPAELNGMAMSMSEMSMGGDMMVGGRRGVMMEAMRAGSLAR
ncbi:hypothetical protein HK101_004550, partial [Irineochytrium annulatum]